MWKIKLVTVALLSLSQMAFAVEPPTAGGQIQQIPPVPVMPPKAPQILIDNGKVAVPAIPATDQAKIRVQSLHVNGESLYSEAELVAITGFMPGGELTLSDLRGMALRITDHYHSHGYFAAQAYLPAQDIKDGAITITVIEGRYGKITLKNHTNLSDNLANGYLNNLHTGDVIASAPLEHSLLLLSDLPGVEVKSTLVPSSTVGASDLIVEIGPGHRVTGSVDADNAGNRYTGEYRGGATVNLNDPIGRGDIATLRVLTSGEGLNYGRASYQLQLGKARVGVAYSILHYELGEEFESLHANGWAHTASVFGSYPLIRTRNNNLYAQLAFEGRVYQDRVDATSTVTDKRVLAVMPGLYGDHRDNFLAGAVSGASLTWTAGNLDIRTREARDADAASARSNGQYNKLGFSAMRLQNVTESVSLYGAINGQFALKNLDVSEKMELGGMYAVRAYPEGEAYADEGYVLTAEARLLLPKFYVRMPGQMHLLALIDTGTVTVNKDPWSPESNSRTLSGAGVGFTWMDANDFSLKTYYARKLGNEAAKSGPDSPGHFWIRIVKYF